MNEYASAESFCYVVWEDTGSYSDYSREIVKVFLSEDAAEAYVAAKEAELEASNAKYKAAQQELDKLWPHGWARDAWNKGLNEAQARSNYVTWAEDRNRIFKDVPLISDSRFGYDAVGIE